LRRGARPPRIGALAREVGSAFLQPDVAPLPDPSQASEPRRIRVEIWSDVVCPWCYLGVRRFEGALARFAHREQVDVVWRSFLLDPNAPREAKGDLYALLMARYGKTRAEVNMIYGHLEGLGAAEGVAYRFAQVRPGSSFDAHRLVQLAAVHGLGGVLHERLARAYFTEGVLLADANALVRLGAEVGLDAAAARQVLAGDAYADAVRADVHRAARFGVRAVPAYVFEEQFKVIGAQTADALLAVFDRVWSQSPTDPSRRR